MRLGERLVFTFLGRMRFPQLTFDPPEDRACAGVESVGEFQEFCVPDRCPIHDAGNLQQPLDGCSRIIGRHAVEPRDEARWGCARSPLCRFRSTRRKVESWRRLPFVHSGTFSLETNSILAEETRWGQCGSPRSCGTRYTERTTQPYTQRLTQD